ncbi:endonuclease/exonuclease/phosphatase family protein [Paenibacillus tuaregi]|uniref:endonuclease/exonuclease/phosphatase family protein n=1 Tax=Paenibacillus tuaregi TaxID=1816681 RepID=UPI0009EDCF0A|nr:endonuclease/exonuclease/phosphatase family protein [Paenibacillus tuaregi]
MTSKELRIMTYNLKCEVGVPPHSWSDRREMVRDVIRRESPDLIGTQEGVFAQISDLLEMLPEYGLVGLGRDGGSRGEYSAIFYKKERFQVLEYNHFWLSDTPNMIASATWGNMYTRMVTWARFKDLQTNQQFYHMNTHFDHESLNAREKSARLVIQEAQDFDSTLPVLLTGDFNTDVHSQPYNILTEEGSFKDTWELTKTRFNEDLGSFNDFRDPQGGSERIDWVLGRGNMTVASAGIINDLADGRFPSDHFPVVARLSLGDNV